jgi:hypothetical protein
VVDAAEHLTLVYLRRLDAKMDQMIETQRDHGRRLTAVELNLAGFAAGSMSGQANLSLRADAFDERLSRLERRFDMVDTPLG